MEHIYRGYRISLREENDGWHAKFWRVSGSPVHLSAIASHGEGSDMCLKRALATIDKFIAYMTAPGPQ